MRNFIISNLDWKECFVLGFMSHIKNFCFLVKENPLNEYYITTINQIFEEHVTVMDFLLPSSPLSTNAVEISREKSSSDEQERAAAIQRVNKFFQRIDCDQIFLS